MFYIKMEDGTIRKIEKFEHYKYRWLASARREVIFDDGLKGIEMNKDEIEEIKETERLKQEKKNIEFAKPLFNFFDED